MSDIEFSNIWENAAVSQRCVLVHGRSSSVGRDEGSILVYFDSYKFPAQRFPMGDGYFKAFVPLEKGENQITFVTDIPNKPQQKKSLKIRYLPPPENPPVHFCLLVAKDSPLKFQSMPYKIEREGNSLELAVRKMRMCAYMTSAFTLEQMNKNQCGFRSYMPYSETEIDTLSCRDFVERETAHIHVVHTKYTVAEINDLEKAQQNSKASNNGALFGMAMDALREYGGVFQSGEFVQAACIYFDSQWNTEHKIITGHAALGGCIGNCRLAIFGGHSLWSWPSSIEEIPAACLDETPTDENYVANDSNQSGLAWENFCIGMGAFQHEIGHLLGCPHQPDGIMLRGYLYWNRAFSALEGFSRNANCVAKRYPKADDDEHWHRTDIIRFLEHPSFSLPGDKKRFVENPRKPVVFAVKDGFDARCDQGIYMIDIYNGDFSRAHFEYLDLPQAVQLKLSDIMNALPKEHRDGQISVHVHSKHMEQTDINNIKEFVENSKQDENGMLFSASLGSERGDEMTVYLPDDKTIKLVRIHNGSGLDGIEFFFEDDSNVLFGKRGGHPDDVAINSDDTFVGLAIRSGAWIDAAGVLTANYRSPTFGGSGGGPCDLYPPQGYKFAGLRGWFQNWCNGLAFGYKPI